MNVTPSPSPSMITSHPIATSPAHEDSLSSTPRAHSSLASVSELKAAVQQVMSSSTLTAPGGRPNAIATATLRRPQCTHVSMSRAYGHLVCSMCATVPDIGWLYACRQDKKPGQYDPLPDLNAVPTPAQDCDFFEATARIAEHLQMSTSIVRGIRAQHYNPAQISELVKQRQHLVLVISEVERCTKESSSTARTTCAFQVCHACRPYFQDRMYSSFDTVMNGEISLDDEVLPMINPRIASTIGLRYQGPESMQDSFGSDEFSVDWTPTITSAESRLDSDHMDNPQPCPCPGPQHCPVWIRSFGCAYDNGWDDGRRAINHKYAAVRYTDRLTPENSRSRLHNFFGTPEGASSTASSSRLPTPATADRLGSGFSRFSLCPKPSKVSLGGELEVEGGVALTEEGVEYGSPDIITSV